MGTDIPGLPDADGNNVLEDGTFRTRCKECGRLIAYGRTDKKFCSRLCKNKWHNRKVKGSRIFRMRVISAIEKNYRILSLLLRTGVVVMDTSVLSQMGFDFNHITGYRKVRRSIEMWCYDIKFTVTETTVKSIQRVDPLFFDD